MNVEVRPYDVVSIPPADLSYVVGQVASREAHQDGPWRFHVIQALSMAEGLDKTAAPQKVHLPRRSANLSRVEIPVNLDSVMSSKAPDMALKPDDVIFLPNNTAKERRHENAQHNHSADNRDRRVRTVLNEAQMDNFKQRFKEMA